MDEIIKGTRDPRLQCLPLNGGLMRTDISDTVHDDKDDKATKTEL